MHQNELARLLLKITGVVVIAYALIGLPQNMVLVLGMLPALPGFWQAVATPQFWGMSFAPFIIYLAIGLFLFLWSGKIADRIVVPVQESVSDAKDFQALEEIAICVLGLYFLAEGLSDAARWAGTEFSEMVRTHRSFGESVWLVGFGFIGSAIVRLFIGIALLLGRRGFIALRRRVVSFRPLANPNRYG
jgi:hypothetical protein